MNNSAFRSHLMQQFAASARSQSRPPLALWSCSAENPNFVNENDATTATGTWGTSRLMSTSAVSTPNGAQRYQPTLSIHVGQNHLGKRLGETEGAAESDHDRDEPSSSTARDLQNLISTRRTVSTFLSHPNTASGALKNDEDRALSTHDSEKDRKILNEAIQRAVQCASTAPNHHVTEPTTFRRILADSKAAEKLLDVTYEVTLRNKEKKLCDMEICRCEAMRKKEKWATIPAFLVATVSGMENQCPDDFDKSMDEGSYLYDELPFVGPNTNKRLENYASACAAVQNLLLSLHSEGLGAKWATGPVVRTRGFRELVGCKDDDMVVGLIFVGWPKRVPRMPRRRRELEGDLLRDVKLD